NLPDQRLRLSRVTCAPAPRPKLGGPWQAGCASTLLRLAAGLETILRRGASFLFSAGPRGVSLAGPALPENPHERYPVVYENIDLVHTVRSGLCWADARQSDLGSV